MDTKDRYADVFDESLEPRLVPYVERIEGAYSAAEPPAQLSWARFHLQVRQHSLTSHGQHRLVERWLRPKAPVSRRMALILSMLSILLLLSGFAYATGALGGMLGTLFGSDPASRQLMHNNQFTMLHQSQTVDGYQVRLDSAYADANRVILGIIVTYPHGIDRQTWSTSFVASHPDMIRLTTLQGQALSFLGSEEALNTSNPKAGQEGDVMEFDAAIIQGNSGQLPLKLTLGVECSFQTTSVCKQTLTYTFTLPFHAGTIINVHKEVMANGHPQTLERVVITPSETRFYIHWEKGDMQQLPVFDPRQGVPGPATYTQTVYDLHVSVNGQTYHLCQLVSGELGLNCPVDFGRDPYRGTNPSFIDAGGLGGGPLLLNNDPQTTGVSLYQPLYGQQGTWTLTITKFNQQLQRNGQNGYDGGAPVKDDAASPWVFTFHLS